MELHGQNIIGSQTSATGHEILEAINPATGATLPIKFHIATEAELNQALTLAESAFHQYRHLIAEVRAVFLEHIADEIMALGDALIEMAQQETAVAETRLIGERLRTVNQLRMFAGVIREGSWLEARIDRALPDRQPLPRPDLRRMLIPIGPVAVFGASNFPLALSVAGADTASALAAGNPVIVKAHPAHPGTSEMAARAITKAIQDTQMPEGVFSLLHGKEEVGLTLVRHPLLQAVGFTGSLRAGRALFDATAARARPIPVYAEMGSVNPVFILPGALKERGETIAKALHQSVTLGVGQFCTNPGLVLSLNNAELEPFVKSVAHEISQTPPASMLYAGICKNYSQGLEALQKTQGVQCESQATAADPTLSQANAALYSTTAETFLNTPSLAEEVFGPNSLIVACDTPEEMAAVAQGLEGQLTATIHGTPDDLRQFRSLISILETKVGRLIFNGFPTGVEVSPAMQHGGPYPATTDSRSTSVGTAAIQRFARPICYQDFPHELLPEELQNANHRQLWRLVDNQWTQEPILQ